MGLVDLFILYVQTHDKELLKLKKVCHRNQQVATRNLTKSKNKKCIILGAKTSKTF